MENQEGRELTTVEKLAALDDARKRLETQNNNKVIIERAKALSKELRNDDYYQLAQRLGINPLDLKKIVMVGFDEAIKDSDKKVAEAEKVIETYLK